MSSYYGRNYSSGSDYPTWLTVLCIGFIVVVLGVSIYRPFNKASDMRDVTVTVTDKVVKNDGNNSKYLVFTEEPSIKGRRSLCTPCLDTAPLSWLS